MYYNNRSIPQNLEMTPLKEIIICSTIFFLRTNEKNKIISKRIYQSFANIFLNRPFANYSLELILNSRYERGIQFVST